MATLKTTTPKKKTPSGSAPLTTSGSATPAGKKIEPKKKQAAVEEVAPVVASPAPTPSGAGAPTKSVGAAPRTSVRVDDNDDFELPADFMPAEEEEGQSADGTAVHQSDSARPRSEARPGGSLGEAGRYFEAVGRRKSAIARVRLFTRAGDFSVNGKPYEQYFATIELRNIVEDSLKKMKLLGRFRVSAKMSGGGMHGQAEALRHGLARCLVKFNPDFRKRLRRAGFMTRDPRVKERKKFGLKKARKSPQWAKR